MQSSLLRFLGLSLIALIANTQISRAEDGPSSTSPAPVGAVESKKPQDPTVKPPEKTSEKPQSESKKDGSKKHSGMDHSKKSKDLKSKKSIPTKPEVDAQEKSKIGNMDDKKTEPKPAGNPVPPSK